MLDGRLRIKIVKLRRGDLPDWVASTPSLSSLTVAEAKGCHDRAGPAKALSRAWEQASRVDIQVNGKPATIKRIAVATRWGVARSGPADPYLSVRDPEDAGEPITSEESDALYIGILRRHVANLIDPLGHHELATLLRQLSSTPFPRSVERISQNARQILDQAPVKEVTEGVAIDGLIGGIVTRAGPLGETLVTTPDQDTMARLSLRPLFVGIERSMIVSAINGEAATVRKRLDDKTRKDEIARSDKAGGWIIPLGEDQRHVKDI